MGNAFIALNVRLAGCDLIEFWGYFLIKIYE